MNTAAVHRFVERISRWLAHLGPFAVALSLVARSAAAPLPQDHEYQTVLRNHLATLVEADFAVELKPFTVPEPPLSAAELYRLWTFTAGGGYGWPRIHGLRPPAAQFTLSSIEAGDAVQVPAGDPLALAWLSRWNYAGNPYFGSRALRMRAFVLAVVDMIMLDALHEKSPGRGANRSDFLGGTLIWLAYAYDTVRDELPAEVRAAYETGLRKFVARLEQWGPTGAMTDMDLFAPVGLKYTANATGDPQIERAAKACADRLFSDPRYFRPAGYFVDVKAFDVSYNGISLFFNAWAALLADWPSAREALARAYRLKNHLTLPEPDGKNFFGPSHFSSRTSADAPHDQWNWPHRDVAAALVTDEALFTVPLPDTNTLSRAPAHLAHYLKPAPSAAAPQPWKETHWTQLNLADEFYRDGFYERRVRLEAEKSPLLKPVFARPGHFVRAFEKDFLIAKFDRYGVILHTGPVSPESAAAGKPYGFSGGALSAFWTPQAGSVLLGRRRGFQGGTFDTYDEWRLWPTHAVSGLTAEGKVVTSARIESPQAEYKVGDRSAVVRVKGAMPRFNAAQGKTLQGEMSYERSFVVQPGGVQIETTLRSDGKDSFSELYETLPVFYFEASYQRNLASPKIQFRIGRDWVEATTEPRAGVRAVQIERFDGAVEITFARPQRVRLSPQDWQDQYQTRATCRNVLVDLRPGGPAPNMIKVVSLRYRLAPAAPARPKETKEAGLERFVAGRYHAAEFPGMVRLSAPAARARGGSCAARQGIRRADREYPMAGIPPAAWR